MPIVSIESVVTEGEKYSPEAIKKVADDLGDFWGSAGGQTWVKVRYLDKDQYAENGTAETPQPIFVEVLQRELREEAVLAQEAIVVARIVADALSVHKELVHIIYLPEGAGRIAFGGNLVRHDG